MAAWAKSGLVLLGLWCLHCTFYTRRPGDDNGPAAGAGSGSGGPQTGTVTGSPPAGEWVNATGNLVDVPAGFGNLTILSSKPDQDLLIAGVSEAGLWASSDGGSKWRSLGGGSSIGNRPASIIYDPKDPMVFWESANYGDGVFKTTDGGATLKQLGTISRIDLVSIDFSDPDRKTLLAGVHESGTIYRSIDGGSTWEDITASIPQTVNRCGFPFVIDAQTYLLACNQFGGALGGILKTTDGGSNWTRVSEAASDQEPLRVADGTIYWSGQLNSGLLRSLDEGTTWASVVGPTNSVHPVELPNGSIATINAQYIVLSPDRGATWQLASPLLPFSPGGLAYSAFQHAFFIWHLSSDATPPADAIARFAYDIPN